jgi:polysaccharide export outer membrane protein
LKRPVFLRLFLLTALFLVPSVFAEETASGPEKAPRASAKSFTLQPGDRLTVQVFREKDLTGDYTIDPSGKLMFPLVGEIQAAGLTTEELHRILVEKLRKYLINPHVSLSKAKATIKSISILGHVKKPGTFDYAEGATLMRVISMAEGFAPSANSRKIRIIRTKDDAKEVIYANAQDIVNGRTEDVELEPGDMIFVPESIF